MSLCGCYPACSCQLNVTPPELLSLVGTGDPATGGWTLTAAETVFTGVAGNNAIGITPGGSYGHNPIIGLNIEDSDSIDLSIGDNGLTADVRIDPSSTAPVSVGPDGLKIDCCAEGGVDFSVNDTNSVDMTLAGAVVTADVIPNTLQGVEVGAGGVAVKLQDDPAAVTAQPENRLAFTTAGDLVTIQDGVNLISLSNSLKVNVPFADGGTTTAFSDYLNNNSGTDIIVEFYLTPLLALTTNNAYIAGSSYEFDFNLRTTVSGFANGAVAFGNGAGRGLRFSNPVRSFASSSYAPAVNSTFVWSGPISSTIYMPDTSSCNVSCEISNELGKAVDSDAWENTNPSSHFIAYNRFIKISPARVGTARSLYYS